MLFSLIDEHVKGRNSDVEGCGLITCVFLGSLCRFPPLVLSRSGFCNIDYLFEYSERSGIHYQRPSLRWHYPDQVQPVGGEIGHPLSLAFPSSHSEQI
jgi:hypothetical protein